MSVATEELEIQQFMVERHELLKKRAELTAQKLELQHKLSAIKNQIRASKGSMTREQYVACCNGQNAALKQMGWTDKQLSEIRVRLNEVADFENVLKRKLRADASVCESSGELESQLILNHVRALLALRKHYQDFSADLTRVSSMRQMAAEFVLKLEPIIQSINGVGR